MSVLPTVISKTTIGLLGLVFRKRRHFYSEGSAIAGGTASAEGSASAGVSASSEGQQSLKLNFMLRGQQMLRVQPVVREQDFNSISALGSGAADKSGSSKVS